VVFEQPSVEKLSRFLHALSSGQETAATSTIEADMQDLIEKYSNIASSKPSSVVSRSSHGACLSSVCINELTVSRSSQAQLDRWEAML
jgi:hypothetical protein